MIQVTTNEVKKEAVSEYPKVMQSETGRIVLFLRFGEGVVLYEKETAWGIGHYAKNWVMGDFKPMNTPVTIQNV